MVPTSRFLKPARVPQIEDFLFLIALIILRNSVDVKEEEADSRCVRMNKDNRKEIWFLRT